MDAELLREIPGYKAILKAVLKSQIQMLVEQLSSQGEEESILLTASLSDGTLHHLGSLSGKNFLDGREEIKSQFLFHCLNGKSRNSHSDQEQIFVPQGMIPPEESYHQMARPAKKPRRTLPFPSGRGRKAQSQIRAGTGNLKRPRSAATVTRPAVSVVPVATETQTRTVPGHDLVTVKAEDFEWNIDLNAESGERVEAPVDNDQSDMDKTNHPKQGNISVPASTRRSFSSDKSDLNMNSSVGEVKVSDGCDVVEMLKDSVVPVKVELADEFERAGLESGASQGLYGGPGPSGDMDNSTWAPGVSEGMESFGSEAESLNASVDHGNQSSSSVKPVFHRYWDVHGFLKTPRPGPRKYAMKRKLVQKTIAEKYEAILELERGEKSKTEIARMFNVPLSTLSGWIKDAQSIKDGYVKFGPGRYSMRKGNFEGLETELFRWCTEMLDRNIQLSGPFILEKARSLADQLGTRDCKLSNGWLERFKERHGFKFKKSQAFNVSKQKVTTGAVNTSSDAVTITSISNDQIVIEPVQED